MILLNFIIINIFFITILCILRTSEDVLAGYVQGSVKTGCTQVT